MSPVGPDMDVVVKTKRRRGRRVWLIGTAAAIAALCLLYLAVLLVAPALSRPKVARGGWRPYKCEALGGSNPPEFRSAIGLEPDYEILTFTSVRDGDTVYVAGSVSDLQGRDRGAAVWTARWKAGGPVAPVRAANDVARSVAASPGGSEQAPLPGAVDAAVSCAAKP